MFGKAFAKMGSGTLIRSGPQPLSAQNNQKT